MSNYHSRTPGRRGGGLGRKSRNTFTTRSGNTIKVNRSLTDKIKARKDAYARSRAERLAGMPKSRVKRFFYRLHPKRMYHYWFSREGLIMGLKLTGIGLIAGFLLLVGLFAYFRKDLPNLRDISGNNLGGSIRYYDRTNRVLLWEDFNAFKRIQVRENEISDWLRDATVAVEDREFFRHGGFDMRGIVRAAFNNAKGGSTQGGSTITQQLVRLTQSSVGSEQTYTRKVKEVILSVELERSYSKREILTGYLNTAPYGDVQMGVESAARDYFRKSARQVTLDEAAFLAAIPKAPSVYSPYGPRYNRTLLVQRQRYILDEMFRQGMITVAQRDRAKSARTYAKVHQPPQKFDNITAPWFALRAKDALTERFTASVVKRGGWRVRTTLDLNLQRRAEEKLAAGMDRIRAQGGDVAAFVAEDVKTGQVVAMVGGPDFNNTSLSYSQVNYATEKLPPGSSIKPYDYAALMERRGAGAGSVIHDTMGPIPPGYPCTVRVNPTYDTQNRGDCVWNYDRVVPGPGPITIRYALGGSRNIPAVKAMTMAGIKETQDYARALGLRSGYNCYDDEALTLVTECRQSSAIGDGAYLRLDEHVHAYASFSRNGRNVPQSYILEITDASGKVVNKWTPSRGEQAVRPDTAYMINDILSDPNASYFSGAKPQRYNGPQGPWRFALKTGTTNDAKDGWLLGYSSRYAAGVWVGYHNRSQAMSGGMELMTRPIWEPWMQETHANMRPEEWQRPSGVQTLPTYVIRNHVGYGSVEPSPATDLFPSWHRRANVSTRPQTIDRVSNRLATDCTPPRARQTTTGTMAGSITIDDFVPGGSSGAANVTTRDNIHQCSDRKPAVRVSINRANGDRYQIVADITQGRYPLSSARFPGTVILNINGQAVATRQINGPGAVTFAYTNTGGNKSVNVIVVDSVLYEASGSGSIAAASSSSGGASLRVSGAIYDGTGTTINWIGGRGLISVYTEDGDLVCASGGNSCDDDDNLQGQRVYVRDSSGARSPLVTVQ